jgi:hypothetical protein
VLLQAAAAEQPVCLVQLAGAASGSVTAFVWVLEGNWAGSKGLHG